MYLIVYMHFVCVPSNGCWLGVWRWSRSTEEHPKEWLNWPAPKIGGVDVEIIRCDLISDILSRHFWVNWRWPQKASITTAICKPRSELSTTWLRCKNSNYSTATFGFLLHLPFITIIIIIIIVVKVAEWFRSWLEIWLAVYACGKQISAVYVTGMLTIVLEKAHY